MTDIGWPQLAAIWPELAEVPAPVAAQIAVDAHYSTYLDRQDADIETLRAEESIAIPETLDPADLPGLSIELQQKLRRFRPSSLAQAARIDGMTPAALMLLLAHIRKAQPRRRAV